MFLTDAFVWLDTALPQEMKELFWGWREVYFSPWFWGMLALILCLERIRPVVPTQRAFSWGMLQDFVWLNLDMVFQVMLLPAVAVLTGFLYREVAGDTRIPLLAQWPGPLKVVAAVAIFDFLMWTSHWVRHRVEGFWHFHAVHHSQRELNVFTQVRVHAGEHVIHDVLLFVPLLALDVNAHTVMGVGGFRLWYDRFIHANIRTNLGWLKHVLVTPQFHRVHHSIEPRHQNKNLGSILTIWDRMFGTLYRGYDEWPATGVAGMEFEPTRSLSPAAWLRDYLRLFLYPFRQLLGRRRGRGGSEPERQGVG